MCCYWYNILGLASKDTDYFGYSGWMLEVWQNYISMELLLGNVKEARTLYKRCYSRRLEGTGTQVLRTLYVDKEYGSLLTF